MISYLTSNSTARPEILRHNRLIIQPHLETLIQGINIPSKLLKILNYLFIYLFFIIINLFIY